jgi:multidrug efflux system membrane fusion protein
MVKSDSPLFLRLKAFGLPAGIIAVTVAVIFILMATRPVLVPVETPERTWPVEVVQVSHQTIQPDLELFGEVVAGRLSELRPLVNGLIIEVGPNFEEGGRVEKGELLLKIDPFDYRTDLAEQQAQLSEARAKLAKLRRDHERAKELFAEKNVSEQFLDDSALAVIEQESMVTQREIGVQRAKKDLEETRLVSPFGGVLKDVNADLGKQFSGFGDNKVADLIDTSRVDVKFSLSNAQYGRLLETGEPVAGRPVEVSWKVGKKILGYDAKISRVGAAITSTTGGIDIYAVIETGGQQTELRPGAFVRVKLSDKRYEGVIAVPDSALYGSDRIYVVKDDRLSERRVQVQGDSGTSLIISSASDPPIVDGDLIVVTQLREGGPGSKVIVR